MKSLEHVRHWHYALRNLAAKDFRIRYRNMALGILWSVINPLVMLGVLTFIFSYVYPAAGVKFFPVFVLLGLVGFNLFSRCVTQGTVSVLENAPLVKKVAFPRLLIPLSAVISQLMDGLIMICILAVLIVVFGVPVTWHYLWLPLIYLVEIAFILGVSLITSALNVYYRDMRYLVESGLTILFWLTPIFYPLSAIKNNLPSVVYYLYLVNPLAGCIHSTRLAVLEGKGPDPFAFGIAVGVTVATLLTGLIMFEVLQKKFADRM